ncbi:MAG: hypothetical protein AB8C95_00205 [Phycisphaeraceae bacterium]
MMTDLNGIDIGAPGIGQTLGFGMIGWQELLILGICPAFTIGLTLLILFLTGVIGKRK